MNGAEFPEFRFIQPLHLGYRRGKVFRKSSLFGISANPTFRRLVKLRWLWETPQVSCNQHDVKMGGVGDLPIADHVQE